MDDTDSDYIQIEEETGTCLNSEENCPANFKCEESCPYRIKITLQVPIKNSSNASERETLISSNEEVYRDLVMAFLDFIASASESTQAIEIIEWLTNFIDQMQMMLDNLAEVIIPLEINHNQVSDN